MDPEELNARAPVVPSVTWHSNDKCPVIHCPAPVLEDLAEIVMGGFRRYPWGGVEIGGVLFGLNEPDGVHIRAFRPFGCEHEHGPALELSATDFENLGRLLASAASDEGLRGFIPVGWYHSVSSRRELSLSNHDRALHARFFPEPWQIAMTLKRSQKDPLMVGFFCTGAGEALSAHSPAREFAIEDFRLRAADLVTVEPVAEVPISAVSEMVVPQIPAGASSEPIDRPEVLELPPVPPENPYHFLGLVQDPFAQAPDAQFFYPTAQHREALAILLHGIQSRKGFLVLIGEAGLGKSLVLECLMERLKEQAVEFAFLFNPKITSDQFLELMAHELDLKYAQSTKASVLIALREHLFERCQAGQTTVLIVDNAQKLGVDVLEEIELLGNLENRRGSLLQVIFAAQPGFELQLESEELRGLRQRLFLHARLDRLSAEDTTSYVERRLNKAGLVSQRIFPTDVLSEIHVRTRGVPRLVNALCSELLQMCLGRQIRIADLQMLDRASAELDVDRPRTEEELSPEGRIGSV
jgi:general secretion pathway protein A